MQQHLEELRSTLIRVAIIIAVSFFITYGLGSYISEYLLAPLRTALGNNQQGEIVYLGVLDKVLSQFQVAFWSSIILSSPLWFFEVWRFIRPALHKHEAKVIRPFILCGFLLFVLGILFGYYIVFPFSIETLMGFGVDDITATIGIKDYLVLSVKVLVFLGIVFQLPNILLVLGFMGIVNTQSLNSMRRYVYVAFAVLSAMITPPDIVTMLGLWLPLVALFEVGTGAVYLIVRPYMKRQESNPY